MSKASVDTSLTESLVYKFLTLDMAEYVRKELVQSSNNCWFFLYKHSCELYVTNEWGGKIKPEILDELKAKAEELINNKNNPSPPVLSS